MRGTPQLHSASGADRRPRWIGRVLVVDDDAADVRRRYRREDALPLAEASPDPGPSRPSVSTLARRFIGLSGAPAVPRPGSE